MSTPVLANSRRLIRATITAMAAISVLGMIATSVQAAPITRTFTFAATDFIGVAPVDPAMGTFTVTFDPAGLVEVFDQTSISLVSLNFSLGSQLSFGYRPALDQLVIGGLQDGANFLSDGNFDFGLAFTGASGAMQTPTNFILVQGGEIFQATNIQVSLVPVPEPVPEPMSLAMLGMGLTGMAFARRRKAARANTGA